MSSSDDKTFNLKPNQDVIAAPDVPGYKITGLLGEGGMGTVYEALQEAPHRKVAIKVLHRGSQSAFVRFQIEAEIMARLDHPGIANVVEAGVAEGHPFLVMDFIEGATLDAYIVGRPLRARLEQFVAICDAVHHAHLKGVVHRDLKPSNVMVRADGRAVVLDFGVARLADDSTPGPTRAGELIGTPLYMSPEQARLRPDEVDARTDVYTLGVILYELASDDLPYEAPPGLPLPVLATLICDEPPVPLGRRVPALRGDLEAIAAKALAKDPADRYQSVAALADDVRRYLDERPVSVRMPGALERARRFVRRRPLAAAAAAGGALAVLVFAAIVTTLWLDARSARRLAEHERSLTEVARAALETRTTELTLEQARAALARDPTEALAWLATLPAGADVDARVAWMIADEARARGVAADVVQAHSDEVHWIEPLGAGFVSGAYDGRVNVWSPAPKTVLVLDGRHRVHVARSSRDGTRIAVGGDGGTLVVIGRDGGAREALGSFHGDVEEVTWSSDDGILVAGTDHGDVQVFAHGTGPARVLATDGSGVHCLAVVGDHVSAGFGSGLVRTWNLRDGSHVDLVAHDEVVGVWTDGARVIAISADGVLHGPGGDIATNLRIKRAVFTADGSTVFLGGVGGEVLRVAGGVATRLHTHRAQVRSLALSADARWLASGADDGTLVVHDATTGRTLALHGHAGRIRHLAFAGSMLYSGDSDGVIRRWDLAELGTQVLTTSGAPVERFAVGAGTIVAADRDGGITRWWLATGVREELGHVEGRVSDLAVAGPLVVTATADGRFGWHGTRPAPIAGTLPPPFDRMAASPRALAIVGDELLIASTDSELRFVATSGMAEGAATAHEGGTDAIAVAPDGTMFATGGQDRAIRVWSRSAVASWQPRQVLDGPHGDTHFLMFSPDGARLVSGGNDGAVYAWSVHDGVVDASSRVLLAQHTGAVTALAVDNDSVVSAGRDLALVRTARDGSTTRATITTAATTLALGPAGSVFAVTRGGSALRWEVGRAPVVEIDHGVVAAAAVDGARWVLGFDDGAVVIVGLGAVTLGDLRARIAALTSYRIPAH